MAEIINQAMAAVGACVTGFLCVVIIVVAFLAYAIISSVYNG